MVTAMQIFSGLCLVTGAVALFAGVLWLLGQACVWLLSCLRIWNTLLLCVGVQLHGKKYRDDLFWKAVREQATTSDFAAQTIADFALRHKPGPQE